MREMGITAIYPAPRLGQPHPEHKIYPYLLRNLEIERPNQVWGLDITFIRMRSRWLYLAAVLDEFSRFVVSWELSQSLEIDFVLAAIDRALMHAAPEICNTDHIVPMSFGKAVNSPARVSRKNYWKLEPMSAWMAAAEPWTTSSPNGSGEVSNMRRCICMTMIALVMLNRT